MVQKRYNFLQFQKPTLLVKIQTVPWYSLSTARYSVNYLRNHLIKLQLQLKLVQTAPEKGRYAVQFGTV